MASWPTPKTITALRAFLGLTGFYRRFVANYATIANPLIDLLKSNSFHWNETAYTTFQKLKLAMQTLPLLTLPILPNLLKLPQTPQTLLSVLCYLKMPTPLPFLVVITLLV